MPMRSEHVLLLDDLDAADVELLLGLAGPESATVQLMVEIRRTGGALERPLRGETAFPARDARWFVFMIGLVLPGADELVAAARRIVDGLAPITRPGGMPHFVPRYGPEWSRQAFPASTAERLAALSRRYDPAGVLLGGQVVRELSPLP